MVGRIREQSIAEVREKALALAMSLASPRNVEGIVVALRKQLQVTREEEAAASPRRRRRVAARG